MSLPDKPSAQLLGSNGPVHAVTYSASPGAYILTGSSDRTIRLYNPDNRTASSSGAVPEGRLVQTYQTHGYEVLGLCVSSDNERFASCGGDRTVYLWDVAGAVTTRRFAHGSRVNAVRLAGAGGCLVVSGGADTAVKVWDTRSNSTRAVQELDEARDAVTSLAVPGGSDGGGSEIIAGSVDGRVRSYDVRAGRVTTDVLGASVTSLSLSRDARTLLVGSLDSRLRLMDRDAGSCLRAYHAPGYANTQLRVQSMLGRSERYVLAGDEAPGPELGDDGRIWAWDLLSAKLVATIRVPWGPGPRKKVVGRDGKEKPRTNVVSCMDWRDGGWGDQFCVGGSSGVVTVYGE